MKKIVRLTCLLSILFVVARTAAGDSRVQFDRLGTELWIPKEFISQQSYSWIDSSEGLDSDKNSIRLRFRFFQDLEVFAVLTVLSEKEQEKIQKLLRREAEDRLKKRGRFSNALVESSGNGFNKVFLTDAIKSKWSLVKVSPSSKWIAECSTEKITEKTVCVSSWLHDEFLLEITADDRYIDSFDEITGEVEEQINQWRVKPKRGD